MAILADQDRFDTWAEFMRLLSDDHQSVSISKADLRAAVDAIDAWVNDNTTSFNSAIPQPARASLTASQKARLLMLVVGKRFVKGA